MYSSVSLENNALKLKNARLVSSYNGIRLPQICRGKTCTAASYSQQHEAFPDNINNNNNLLRSETRSSMHSKEPIHSQYRYMPCAAVNDTCNTVPNKYSCNDNRCDEVNMEVAYVKSQILDTILEEKYIESLPFPPSHLLALYPPSYQKDLICYYYQLQKLYPDLYSQYVQYYEEYYKPVYMSNGNIACVFQKGAFVPAATNCMAGGVDNNINQLGANQVNGSLWGNNGVNGVVNSVNDNSNNNNSNNKKNDVNNSGKLLFDKQQQEEINEQREELKLQQHLLKKLQKELLSNQKKQLELIEKLAEEKSKEREHDELQRRLEAQRLQLRQQQQDRLVQSLAAKNNQPPTQTKAPNIANSSDTNKMANKREPPSGLSRQASNLSTTSLGRQSSIRRQNSMRRNEINKIQNEGGGLQRLPSMHK